MGSNGFQFKKFLFEKCYFNWKWKMEIKWNINNILLLYFLKVLFILNYTFRVYSESIQSLFRVYSESIQSRSSLINFCFFYWVKFRVNSSNIYWSLWRWYWKDLYCNQYTFYSQYHNHQHTFLVPSHNFYLHKIGYM